MNKEAPVVADPEKKSRIISPFDVNREIKSEIISTGFGELNGDSVVP